MGSRSSPRNRLFPHGANPVSVNDKTSKKPAIIMKGRLRSFHHGIEEISLFSDWQVSPATGGEARLTASPFAIPAKAAILQAQLGRTRRERGPYRGLCE